MSDKFAVRKQPSKAVRTLLIIAGTVCVALAFIGVLIPVFQTTLFLLLAAAAYARSSERFYTWLTTNRVFGDYIRNYREGRGIALRHKLLTMLLLWGMIGTSAIFFVETSWGKLILLVVAVGVSVHIITIKTALEAHKQPAKRFSSRLDYEDL
jgi:uncharacterized membrane protein YbaN (DUF454 family)